jgi:hypothetical protein
MDAVQEFETWSSTKLNLNKTVVLSINGGSGEMDPPQVTYKQQPDTVFQATKNCRHLGYWATPNVDMAKTKQRVLATTKEVLRRASNAPSIRNEDSEGTLPEHGGECISILRGPGAMESSRA